MVNFQIRTGFREKALSVFADSLCHLFLAGRPPEIGRGTAHIVNISLKIFLPDHPLCFPQNGLMASDLYRPSLMKCQSAEITATETSSVAGKGKLNLRDRRHTASLFIGRMVSAHIGQVIDCIHLLRRQRRRRRILYDKDTVRILLDQRLANAWIGVAVLYLKTLRISVRRCFHFFIGGQPNGIINSRAVFRLIDRPRNKGDVLHRNAAGQRIRDLHDRFLPHAVRDQIRLTVQKDGTLETV